MAKSLEERLDITPGHQGRPTSYFLHVGDAYQNKGITSAMLRHLASSIGPAMPGISDLHAHTLPDNRRTRRVLDKLGFPCIATHKRNMMHVTLHLDSTAHPDGSQAA